MTTFTSEDRENSVKNNNSKETFDTLKQAMLQLNISEYKLHSRLKDPNNKEYHYL